MLRLTPLLLLCIVECLAACSMVEPQNVAAKNVQWTRKSVAGLCIKLVDPLKIEQMAFMPEGEVVISFGLRNGSVVRPLFYWKIVSGRLRISSTIDGGKVYEELTLISRDASKIVARRRSGEIVTYEITVASNIV